MDVMILHQGYYCWLNDINTDGILTTYHAGDWPVMSFFEIDCGWYRSLKPMVVNMNYLTGFLIG